MFLNHASYIFESSTNYTTGMLNEAPYRIDGRWQLGQVAAAMDAFGNFWLAIDADREEADSE